MEKTSTPQLKKVETLKELAIFLSENPKTQIADMRNSIKSQLYAKGIIGEQFKNQGGGTLRYTIDMHDDDYLLINECIYDLLYNRVITPGMNGSNLELPFVHVNNLEKLKEYL